MKTFEDLEAEAEAKIAATLGRYAAAAPMMGWVFALLLALYAVLLFSGGALVGAVFCMATACVIVWFVSLLRTARKALGAPPLS